MCRPSDRVKIETWHLQLARYKMSDLTDFQNAVACKGYTDRGGATFTEVGGTNHGERSEPEIFVVVPPKRGYKYHFAPSNRGYKIIAKITRRLVQKCTTWFRSTNFTSCSPQNHCTVIFYYGTRYWPISRFCHIFLSPFTVFNAFP